MQIIKTHWKWLLPIACGGALIAYAATAKAADLGGNCCSDLEERIAELEATTARKGNKNVSLVISGQVNKAIYYVDSDDLNFSEASVVENGASETFVTITARAQINKDFAVGSVLEIGQGQTFLNGDIGPGGFDVGVRTDNDVYTRRSYVFGTTPVGTVSVGLLSMATDDLTAASVASTDAAVKRLTFQPIGGVSLTTSIPPMTLLSVELEPFNGKKADAVRYDTRSIGGFVGSAAWEPDSDTWDAALRYAGELSGFAILGGAGYAVDKNDEIFGLFGPGIDVTTITLNGGVKHMTTGLFVQGSWARLEIEAGGSEVDTDSYHVQAGIDRKWIPLGKTTVWAGFMQWDDLEIESYEIGLNQSIAGAADFYVVGKSFEIGDVDGWSGLTGLRVRF